MITIYAKIDLIKGENVRFSIPQSLAPTNNTSSEIQAQIGSKTQGGNPFILGASKLGENAIFSNSENYYISSFVSNSQGVFLTPIEFTISYSKEQEPYSNSLNIIFDTFNNQYATDIEIDGTLYYNDDPVFTVELPIATERVVKINKWSNPFFPARIQGLYGGISIEINKRNLISLNSKINTKSSDKLPSWGVISNSCSIDFIDRDGEIYDYASLNLLKKGVEVTFYLKNSISKKEQEIGTFNTDEWNYDNDTREVSLTLKDDLEEWQNIVIDGLSVNPNEDNELDGADIYYYLYDKTPNKFNMVKFSQLDGKTKHKLIATTIKYPVLKSSSLWSAWQKFCEVFQCYIYKDFEGKTVCSYNGGV